MNVVKPRSALALEPAEHVLWSGEPDPKAVLLSAWTRVRRRILVAGGVALLFALSAWRMSDEDWSLPASLAGVAAFVAALSALWPLVAARKARRLSYAVTTERLLIREEGRSPRLRAFGGSDLVPLQVRHGVDGRGDVLFAVESEAVGHPSCGCGAGLCPTPSGRVARVTEIKDRRIEAPVGFEGIADPDAVAAIISERFGIPRAGALH